MRRACIILISAAVVGCGGQLRRGATFNARYFVSDDALRPPLPACATPVELKIVDGRENPDVVGTRFKEGRPDVQYPIRMRGDAAAYVRSSIEKAFERAGRPTVGGDGRTLTVKLSELHLEEKVFYNAEYRGRIGLEAELSDPGSQRPCWSGSIMGIGDNYGLFGSEENYQETLNRALDNATGNLLSTPGLPEALCGRCRGEPVR